MEDGERPATVKKRPRYQLFFNVLIGLLAIAGGLWGLQQQSQDLRREQGRLRQIPLTIWSQGSGETPVVVIAHGFAGSQQLMHPLAVSLARNGYTAVTFDFAGHGRNATPMSGGIKDMTKSTDHLLSEIDAVVRFARELPGSNGSVALVGHSMAAELVVQYAMQKPGIAATVALSLFGKAVTADNPRNLLVITGAWEPGILREAGFRIAGLSANGAARERVTYGDIAAGTARRMVLAAGAEHIGVIYSRDALQETTRWLNAVFDRTSEGFIDTRGKWIGLLVLGLIMLARPLSSLLPKVSEPVTQQRTGGWLHFSAVTIIPMIATPLLLWKSPTDFLPILLGDYLAIHFAAFGLLTLALLKFLRRNHTPQTHVLISWKAFAISAACIAAYQIVIMGLPIDTYVASFAPSGLRWFVIPAMFVSTALFFLADAAVMRRFADLRGAYALTKLCFTISLAIAVALNPGKLFFLAIIVPVIFLFFVFYGLISRWSLRATGEPHVAALANALALAWAIAVTFPIVS